MDLVNKTGKEERPALPLFATLLFLLATLLFLNLKCFFFQILMFFKDVLPLWWGHKNIALADAIVENHFLVH